MEKVLEEVQGEESKKTIGKRRLLALATLAAAGLSIKPLIEKAHADTGQPLIIGTENAADDGDETMLTAKVNNIPNGTGMSAALLVNNLADAIEGNVPPQAIAGITLQGRGVEGQSDSGIGVIGIVWGSGQGVRGEAWGNGVGVSAVALNKQVNPPEPGIALKVEGKSDFNGKIGDPLIVGEDNEASFGDMTRLITHAGDKSCGFGVDNTTNSVAIQGCSVGIGVAGTGDQTGVHGGSVYGDGIDGHSVEGTGIIGHTDEKGGPGVMGWTSNPNGVGVVGGGGEKGTGVRGSSGSSGGIGVHALSEKGTALRVEGKSSFSTVGNGTIPRLKRSYTVSVAAGLVTANSHISVTLTSDPTVLAGDAAISWIQRDPANNRFTINLNKAVGKDTTFTYFIVEP